MFASLSQENQASNLMKELHVSLRFLSEVCPVPVSHTGINNWLDGRGALTPAQAGSLVSTLKCLKRLADGLGVPCRFSGRDAQLWRELVRRQLEAELELTLRVLHDREQAEAALSPVSLAGGLVVVADKFEVLDDSGKVTACWEKPEGQTV